MGKEVIKINKYLFGVKESIMQAATFCCNICKIKFQLIEISTEKNPRHCPYCGIGPILRNFCI